VTSLEAALRQIHIDLTEARVSFALVGGLAVSARTELCNIDDPQSPANRMSRNIRRARCFGSSDIVGVVERGVPRASSS